MSIDRDRFRDASEGELRELSVTERVLGFLVARDDRAFEAAEIASRVDLDESAVSTALTRLKQRGLVEHKATYWAVTEDEERLAAASGYERATALFNERLAEEDREEWRDRAPDEPHPSVADER
ncbi:MarR family transcriptional regulator [Halosimplex rubrum]|uniref:MarR family transcriptional regulator n=1 Tax=Halosimplex rubrum TaxID=869889 RepID=A0A7D5P402_9EURY|nr:helix-turn-helix domain-containing protein [Halosimplex rubrum]QLH76985.1 MarR family transcriptional regulator [Halosimplex rubrum]